MFMADHQYYNDQVQSTELLEGTSKQGFPFLKMIFVLNIYLEEEIQLV